MLINKYDLAEKRFKGMSFDCALPQQWVNEMQSRGVNVLPHFVWLYPRGDIFGHPAPIDGVGDDIAKQYLEGE